MAEEAAEAARHQEEINREYADYGAYEEDDWAFSPEDKKFIAYTEHQTQLEREQLERQERATVAKKTMWVIQKMQTDAVFRDMVEKAVQKNGLVLQYASEDFRKDPSIVLKAIEKDRSALQHSNIHI